MSREHIENLNGEQGVFTADVSNPADVGTGRPFRAGRVMADCVITTLVRPGSSGGSLHGLTLFQGVEILGPISQLVLASGSVDLAAQ